MQNKTRKLTLLFILCLTVLFTLISDVHATRATYYRGSFLMWTRDNVDFEYSKGKITYSSPFQQNGWIFPNIARNKGITRYYRKNNVHKYRAINVIGAGIPTPWGDVKVYSSTFVHRLNVYGTGYWNAYSD